MVDSSTMVEVRLIDALMSGIIYFSTMPQSIRGQRVFFTPRCSALGGKIFLPPRPTTLPRSPPLLPTALKDLGVTFSMPKVFSEKKFSHPQVPQVFEIFFPSCPRCFFFPRCFIKFFFRAPGVAVSPQVLIQIHLNTPKNT